MLVAPLDLVCLHRNRVNAVDHIDEVILVLLVRYHVKMSRHFITVEVAANSNELALHGWILIFNEVVGVSATLFAKLLLDLMSLCWRQIGILSACRCLGVSALQVIAYGQRLGTCCSHWWSCHPHLRLVWITKEIIIFSLVHKVSLIALDHRHIFDGGLLHVGSLLHRRDHTLVEKSVSLISLCIVPGHY